MLLRDLLEQKPTAFRKVDCESEHRDEDVMTRESRSRIRLHDTTLASAIRDKPRQWRLPGWSLLRTSVLQKPRG